MMEKGQRLETKGIEFVLSSLGEAREKLASMDSEEKLRNSSRIWEVYCDIEQAIEVSKFVFGLHDRLGAIRTLRVSGKDDLRTSHIDVLSAKYKLVNSEIASAEKEYEMGNGESAIEFARRARDELKVLLLGEGRMKGIKKKY